jgi:hypothetical protein
MAAVPFTQTLIFRGANNGQTMHIRATVSDVVGQYASFPDGNTFLQLPADQPYLLQDIIVVVGGTDTTNQEIFKNGTNTALIIDNKSNLNTANSRQFQQAPVGFQAGSLLRFKQAA